MAQAPDAGAPRGAGAPRQNKTIKQFSGMNTREFRNAVPEGSFPWLENIQPIGPGDLHSIPGRGLSLARIPPPPVPPPGCTDATVRGQQALAEELRFINNDDLGGNTRTSWSYISPTEEVYTLAGAAGCDGGNMGYRPGCCQINHFIGPGAPFDHPALVDPDPLLAAINTELGVSDEPAYMFQNSVRIYYPASGISVFLDDGGGSLWHGSTFAKHGNDVFIFMLNFGSGDPDYRLARFNATTGAIIGIFSFALTLYYVSNASATDNFVYALLTLRSDTSVQKIARINKTTLAIDALFDLTFIDSRVLFCVNDDLIYVLNGHGALYYLENFTDFIYVGSFSTSISNFSGTGFFTNGAFYYGGTGFAGFSPHIYRVVLPCPDPAPLIASVTTGATVVHGANLTVNWADVLQPTTGDVLYLKPDDGTLFDPSPPATFIPNTGAGSGSIAFPIPGGTAPGSYVIQYVWSATNLVATSAPFTVT